MNLVSLELIWIYLWFRFVIKTQRDGDTGSLGLIESVACHEPK